MKQVENQLTKLIFPIGKHKGEPIYKVVEDATYCNWIIKQEWFKKQYPDIQKLMLSVQPKPSRKKTKKVVHTALLNVRLNPLAICLN